MAGIPSNIGWIAMAKQTAKGSAASAPTVKLLVRSGGIGPQKGTSRYETTDIGRAPGGMFVNNVGVQGAFECYAEPGAMALLWYLLLGANADAGAGPYTHTATPSTDIPYCTIWDSTGGTLTEKYVDCKIGSLTLSGDAGNPLIVSIDNVFGLAATYADTGADALAALAPAGYLFYEAQGAFKYDTVAQTTHRFSMTFDNNLSPYQADAITYSDVDPGNITIDASFECRWTGPTAFPAYKTEFYGGGTTLVSTVPSNHAFQVIWTRTSSLKLQLDLPQTKWVVTRPEKDSGGDPLNAAVSMFAEKPSGSAMITATSTDSTATV